MNNTDGRRCSVRKGRRGVVSCLSEQLPWSGETEGYDPQIDWLAKEGARLRAAWRCSGKAARRQRLALT